MKNDLQNWFDPKVQIPTDDGRDKVNKFDNLTGQKLVIQIPSENGIKTCGNCIKFDPTKIRRDESTVHLGFCREWCQVQSNKDSCERHSQPIVIHSVAKTPIIQLELFDANLNPGHENDN